MNIFKAIFGRNKKIIEDKFFGETQIHKLKNNNFIFSSERYFSPTKKNIRISIEGNELGNLNFANSFFEKIENSYQEVIDAVTPILEDTFQNWKEDFRIIDFHKEFQPIYLYLPTQNDWEIIFETIHDPNHQFTVNMSNMTAKEINTDG